MKRLAKVLVLATLALGSSAYADGAGTFNSKCATCHGKDGKGKTTMGAKLKVKDLTTSDKKADEIVKQVTDGIKDADGKNTMPSFKDKLSDADIKDVAAFAASLKGK